MCKNVPEKTSFAGTGKKWDDLTPDEKYEIDFNDATIMKDRMNGLPLVLNHDDNIRVGTVVGSWLDPHTKDWIAEFDIDESTPLGKEFAVLCKTTRVAPLSLSHRPFTKMPVHLSIVNEDPARFGAEIIEASKQKKDAMINNYFPSPSSTSNSNTMTDVNMGDAILAHQGRSPSEQHLPREQQEKLFNERMAQLQADKARFNQTINPQAPAAAAAAAAAAADANATPEEMLKKFIMSLPDSAKPGMIEFFEKQKASTAELQQRLAKSEAFHETTKEKRRAEFHTGMGQFMKTLGENNDMDAATKKQVKAQLLSGEADSFLNGPAGELLLKAMNMGAQQINASKSQMELLRQREAKQTAPNPYDSKVNQLFDTVPSAYANPGRGDHFAFQDEPILHASSSRKRQRTASADPYTIPQDMFDRFSGTTTESFKDIGNDGSF